MRLVCRFPFEIHLNIAKVLKTSQCKLNVHVFLSVFLITKVIACFVVILAMMFCWFFDWYRDWQKFIEAHSDKVLVVYYEDMHMVIFD